MMATYLHNDGPVALYNGAKNEEISDRVENFKWASTKTRGRLIARETDNRERRMRWSPLT